MRTAFCLMIASTSVVMAVKADTFTGVITDTMCGPNHNMKGHPADQCVKICSKGQYSYALYDGSRIFNLRPKDASEIRGAESKGYRYARSKEQHDQGFVDRTGHRKVVFYSPKGGL